MATSGRKLSVTHKQALVEGRRNSAVVDRYLIAVNTPQRRGRKVTKAALESRLTAARATLATATGVAKVEAAQTVRDCRARLDAMAASNGLNLATLERDFIEIAPTFSKARCIGYGAWRDAGVPARVLKKAGIARTRG